MAPAEAGADIRELRKGITLGCIRIKDLINEGREPGPENASPFPLG